MDQLTSQFELGLDDTIPELKNYSIKVSNRSKNVHLRVLPVTGLEITIPKWFSRKHIPELLEANRVWIEKQLAYVQQNTDPRYLVWPPVTLHLRSFYLSHLDHPAPPDYPESYGANPGNEEPVDANAMVDGLMLNIAYIEKPDSEGLSGRIDGNVLEVSGKTSDKALLLRFFSKLLKREAKRVFEPQVAALAAHFDLNYTRVSIRGQKTLWGSCSSNGTLSLNFKLLFLPPDLVRYVLLHELAHTRYLNHSATFWRLLCAMEPDARRLDRALNEAGNFVPPWFESVT